MKMKKFISALIACAMLFTTMGISAFAAEAETATYVAKIGETGYPSLSAALNGVKANETITVSAGEYSDFYTADDGTTYNYLNSTADLCELPDGVTITAAEGAEVLITNAPHLKAHDFTVEGIDFKGSNLAFQVTGCGTFENCDIYGGNGTYASINNCKDKDLSFINCKVSGDVYGLQVTEGSGNVVINGCEVIGWCSYGVSGSLTIIDSKYYTSDSGYGKLRMYQNATITNTAFGDDVSIDTRSSGLSITFTSCSVVDSTTGQVSSKPLAALIAEDTINDSSVTVDGTVVTEAVEDLVIDNISELSAFANQVNGGNTYEGKTITLNADIDASSLPVTIGTKENPFMGTFDGQGHKISNLSITKYDQGKFYGDYVGLFGVINSPAVVKNVTVENPFIVGRSCVGGIVGSAYTGTVENCHVTGEIDIEGYYKVGGITGDGYAKIINCSVAGAEDWDYSIIKATYSAENYEGDNVGGIIGFKAEGSIDISNCSVKNVTVSGTRKVGGVVGSAFQNNNITNCTVENVTVTTNATEEYASANAGSMGIGGIVGLTSSEYTGGSIADCTVSNLTLKVENELTTHVSAGAITGGHRGTTAPEAPAGTTISGVSVADVEGDNNTYGEMPNAEVKNLGAITIDEYNIYNGSLVEGGDPIDLQIAMEFIAKDTPEQAAQNAFGNYTTDFFITMTGAKDGSFVADGCYLAGNYGTHGWIMIPLDGMTVENGKVYPVITSVGFNFEYVDICRDVEDFKCGIYFSDEVIAANPDLEVTLTLGLSENLEAAQAAKFITVDEPYTYKVADFAKGSLKTKIYGVKNMATMMDENNIERYRIVLIAGLDDGEYTDYGFELDFVDWPTDLPANKISLLSHGTFQTAKVPTESGSATTVKVSDFDLDGYAGYNTRLFGGRIALDKAFDNYTMTMRPYAVLNGKTIYGETKEFGDIYTKDTTETNEEASE